MKTNDDRNVLSFHMLQPKHTFSFFQTTLIKPKHREDYKKPFQNKLYKTTSKFLQHLTILDKHHTKQKQNHNKKRIEKPIFTLWESFSFIFSLSLELLTFPHLNFNLHTTI